MTGLITKLKMMLTGNWNQSKKPPENISPDDYAIIKLKNYDNLPVVIMADKQNGGIFVSYDDAFLQLDAPTKLKIQKEIQTIISAEFERMMKDGNL